MLCNTFIYFILLKLFDRLIDIALIMILDEQILVHYSTNFKPFTEKKQIILAIFSPYAVVIQSKR